MAGDLTNRGPRDGQRVNVNEHYEVSYWTRRFGVRPDELKAAVVKVGVMVKDVERELGKAE
jgi:Protein of unknown function (DUF3606)